jgi:hypothetical protein
MWEECFLTGYNAAYHIKPVWIGFDQCGAKALKYYLRINWGGGGRMHVHRGLDNWVIALLLIRVVLLCRVQE